MFKDIRLETKRLIIRSFKPADADQLHEIVSDEKVLRFLPEEVMTLEEVSEIIAWLEDCYEKNRPDRIIKFTVAIVWAETGQVIGWCGLGPLDFKPSEIELYYGVAKAYWGKGVATEAARALLKYGFEVIGLKRIVAVTDPANIGSVKVLEKLKMRFEKKITGLPDAHHHYENSFLYSMLKSEALLILIR